MLQDQLNKVIEYAAGSEFIEEVYKAKEEYQKIVGNIFEDDESFDTRMAAFLEWYTFDRIPDNNKVTPCMAFIEKNKDELSLETRKIYEDIVCNIHGIFLVKKIKQNYVVVLNLFDKAKYKVNEKQSQIIFRKNDIFEGRIVPYLGENYFTGNYCFHPQKAVKVIKFGIKQLIKDEQEVKDELKKMKNKKSKVLKEIVNFNSKIEQVNYKIIKSRSIIKANLLEQKRTPLEGKKEDLVNQLAKLDENISNLFNIKINKKLPQMRNKLMQRFLYMNLKWERFRKIDIKDIYRI